MTPLSTRPLRRVLPLVLLPALAAATTACSGSDGGETAPSLSPAAAEGRQIAEDRGCLACHGNAGEGGIGPAWVGLIGSERTFDDGSTVVADEAYIRESITDPGARQVEGFQLQMPPNTLTDAEITSVLAYLEALQ